MKEYSTYPKDLEYCKQFIFSFGSNYALGTRLFNKRIREATIFFYSFVRYSDEIVDNPREKMPGQTHETLDEFISEWEEVIENGPTKESHPILRSNYWLFKKYEIPFGYTFDFLAAMKQDLTKERYKNYAELEHYMWGSASIVGHVMTFIVGYRDTIAFEHAKALGEAMQLTNFLRDIAEDYEERGRVYLPQNDTDTFGVTEEMIKDQVMTKELYNLTYFYAEKTEELFKEGIDGIKYLKAGKFSILLASRMYWENIRILKKRSFDIFGEKIRLSKIRRIQILFSTVCIFPFWLLKNKS
ncbi:MAG: phytoene synthase [Candidatus Paceibacteria bacterium]|jgi:phytoene synthase